MGGGPGREGLAAPQERGVVPPARPCCARCKALPPDAAGRCCLPGAGWRAAVPHSNCRAAAASPPSCGLHHLRLLAGRLLQSSNIAGLAPAVRNCLPVARALFAERRALSAMPAQQFYRLHCCPTLQLGCRDRRSTPQQVPAGHSRALPRCCLAHVRSDVAFSWPAGSRHQMSTVCENGRPGYLSDQRRYTPGRSQGAPTFQGKLVHNSDRRANCSCAFPAPSQK